MRAWVFLLGPSSFEFVAEVVYPLLDDRPPVTAPFESCFLTLPLAATIEESFDRERDVGWLAAYFDDTFFVTYLRSWPEP